MKKLSPLITDFLFNLHLPFALPEGVGVLDVHNNRQVRNACLAFYSKFYNDNQARHLMLGINPGRFGGGVTGIPFTDPIRLQEKCGIENGFAKKQELSSVFVYDVIDAFGGPAAFYGRFYISSISPLGFVRNGKNLNYYDDKNLKQLIEPFAADCINRQLSWGLNRDVCFCIGEGENLKYLRQLNGRYGWFGNITALPHPRFVMQYKLKQKELFVEKYFNLLNSAG
ncbi:uracil-DNA glycosylase family protein [Foetidibacter luteolus]|uniref:uracil-DNA glycosylase family protein n=1 Tax=Foetidibacter luteolus TaxID=2608880 RepID=UPI00129BB490|nr:uracil-DNA glycosylase family protein [Foetidibacter luteolus]